MKKKLSALSLILLITAFQILNAGILGKPAYEERKTINKEFTLKKSGSLKVINEFGKIHFEIWDQEKVSFEIEVIVENPNEKKAKEKADKIVPKFSESNGQVTCEVDIPDNVNNGKNERMEVNIKVKMPDGVSLDVKNSFGDVFLPDYSGNVKLNVQYGKLQAGDLKGEENNLKLSFGGGNWGNVNNGDIKISYSEFEMGSCNKLYIDNQFSQGELGDVKDLQAKVSYGEMETGKIEKLQGDFQFSSVEISRLEDEGLFKSNYGDGIEIKTISKDFSKIDVTSQFASVELNFESGASFMLEAEVDFGSLDYREEDFRKIWKDKEKYIHKVKYKGIFGDKPDPSSEVTIRAEYGSIEIN